MNICEVENVGWDASLQLQSLFFENDHLSQNCGYQEKYHVMIKYFRVLAPWGQLIRKTQVFRTHS
jgi:hypothetical protein